MNESLPLSLEQEFKVKVFADQLQFMTNEELQDLVLDLYQNSLVQEKLFQKVLGDFMGIQYAANET